MRWWYKIHHPEIYQGEGRVKNYFEGWYYKIVHQSHEHAIALIPGVAISSATDRHAFIQVMDGMNGQSEYHRFPFELFATEKKELIISIGENRFSKDHIVVNLPSLQVDLQLSGITPLKNTLLSPGIMGWFSYTPRMECYHGVVSMHHLVRGSVTHHGKVWDYDGVGYIEKDWGTSFPKCWFWTHCNTFDSTERVSVMASVAHIPWMGHYFIGFIVALQIGGQHYRFATYNGSRWKARLEDDALILQFKKGNKVLSVKSIKGPSAELVSPISGEMTGKVNESLQAKMLLKLEEDGKVLFMGEGENAGLEIAGEYDILLAEDWRKR